MEPDSPFLHVRAFMRWAKRQPVRNWKLERHDVGASVDFTCATLAEAVRVIATIPWTSREPKLQPAGGVTVLRGTAWGMPVSVTSREQLG